MAKFIDFLFTRLVIFILIFVLSSLWIDNLWLSLAISFIGTFLLSLIFDKLRDISHKNDFNYQKFSRHCVMSGNIEVYNLMEKLLVNENYEKTDKYILLNRKERKELIVASVKYGTVTPDEIIGYRRTAINVGASKLYLICKNLDRKSATIGGNMDISFTFIPLRLFYKILKKHNISPVYSTINNKRPSKLSNFLGIFFSKSNGKRFVFVSIVLLVMSYFIPFRTYYLVVAAISLIFALICFGNSSSHSKYGKNGIFDEYNVKDKKQNKNNNTDNEELQ